MFLRISALTALLFLMLTHEGNSQYSDYRMSGSFGLNYMNFLGKGNDGSNFTPKAPGIVLETAFCSKIGFEWTFGLSHNRIFKHNDNLVTPTYFWNFYSELHFFNPERRNPLMILAGYDYSFMKYGGNTGNKGISELFLGAALNFKLSYDTYLQWKLKPLYAIGNPAGQKYGFCTALCLHIGYPGTD